MKFIKYIRKVILGELILISMLFILYILNQIIIIKGWETFPLWAPLGIFVTIGTIYNILIEMKEKE